jgi:hypothetical protein
VSGIVRNVRVTLVARFDDILTGKAVLPEEKRVKVFAGSGVGAGSLPEEKRDGYYVFTREAVKSLTVKSGYYFGFDAFPMGVLAGSGEGTASAMPVARFGLAPQYPEGAVVHELLLPAGEVRHVGFALSGDSPDARSPGLSHGYTLAADVSEGAQRILLVKNDLRDLTWLTFAVVTKSGDVFPLHTSGSEGHGEYRLNAPAGRAMSARDVRVFPLYRVVGPDSGNLPIPFSRPSNGSPGGGRFVLYTAEEGADSVEVVSIGGEA